MIKKPLKVSSKGHKLRIIGAARNTFNTLALNCDKLIKLLENSKEKKKDQDECS